MSLSFVDALFFFLRVLGLALICASLFLYEDEEGKFQNKIEEWWIKLRDQERVSRSKALTFIRGVAELTGKGFDRLFGARLLSIRVIPVSIYLSFASFFLFTAIAFPFVKNPGEGVTRQGAFFWLLFFLTLALVPALFTNKWLLRLWWVIIPGTLLSISGFIAFAFKTRGLRSTLRGIGLVVLLFLSSLVVDVIYIALTRYVLRRISTVDRVATIAFMMFGNLVALAIALLGPIFVGLSLTKYDTMVGGVIMLSFPLNSVDLLISLAGFFLALFLLLHRLFWPAIQRPLYAIHRFAPIKDKKWLFRIGVLFVFLPNHFTINVLKAILEKL